MRHMPGVARSPGPAFIGTDHDQIRRKGGSFTGQVSEAVSVVLCGPHITGPHCHEDRMMRRSSEDQTALPRSSGASVNCRSASTTASGPAATRLRKIDRPIGRDRARAAKSASAGVTNTTRLGRCGSSRRQPVATKTRIWATSSQVTCAPVSFQRTPSGPTVMSQRIRIA
jgi:hypothetical protein